MRFDEALSSYLEWARGECKFSSWRRIGVSFVSLSKIFDGRALASIEPADVERFKTARRRAGIRPVTIRHDLHALSGFVRFAMRHGWIQASPLAGVKIPSDADAVRIHVIGCEEELRYFNAASSHAALHDFGRLMILTGMRPSEVLSLRAADYRLESIYIREGKTRAARRTLKLTVEACAIARRRTQGKQPGEWWFAGRKKGEPAKKLNNAHIRACQLAGVNFCPYDFRHTFATRMAERGMPLTTLAAILGHGSLRCVMRYVHPSQAVMDEAMLRFAS